jgi:hypothetical protein
MPTQISTNYLPTLSYRNRLINGAFDFWQRGTSITLTNAEGYTCDRWKHRTGTNGVAAISRQAFVAGQTDVPGEPTYFLQLNQSVAGTSPGAALLHRIEDVRTLAGKYATVSFYAKAASSTGINIGMNQSFGSGGSGDVTCTPINPPLNLTTGWGKFSYTFLVPSIAGKTVGAGNYLQLYFVLGTTWTGTIMLSNVQVEEGQVASSFEKRHPQQELALCQRYYEKSYDIDTALGAVTSLGASYISVYHGGWPGSISVTSLHTTFRSIKRVLPTVTIYSTTGASGQVLANGASVAGTVVVGPSTGSFAAAQSSSNGSGNSSSVFYHWTADSEL